MFANVDMMPDMVDPLNRISFVKSANITTDVKEAARIFGAIADNPRDPSIKNNKKTLFTMAQNELDRIEFNPSEKLSKCALARKIIDQRISKKKNCWVKWLTKVGVNGQHPFVLEIKPASYGQTSVRLFLSCVSLFIQSEQEEWYYLPESNPWLRMHEYMCCTINVATAPVKST